MKKTTVYTEDGDMYTSNEELFEDEYSDENEYDDEDNCCDSYRLYDDYDDDFYLYNIFNDDPSGYDKWKLGGEDTSILLEMHGY